MSSNKLITDVQSRVPIIIIINNNNQITLLSVAHLQIPPPRKMTQCHL